MPTPSSPKSPALPSSRNARARDTRSHPDQDTPALASDTTSSTRRSPLLLAEPPLIVLPSLARAVGLNEAIVLQQLHFLLGNPANGKVIRGRRWIFNSLDQWVVSYFPFWCKRTLGTIFQRLEARGLVDSCQPDGRLSRRKYYTLNAAAVALLPEQANLAASMTQPLRDAKAQTLREGTAQTLPHGTAQPLRDGMTQPLRDPSTETTAEITAEISPETTRQRVTNTSPVPPPVPAREARDPGLAATPPVGMASIETAMRRDSLSLEVGEEEGREPVATDSANHDDADDRHADADSSRTPTAEEWERFMEERHPELVPNPGWDWCQAFHAECRGWMGREI